MPANQPFDVDAFAQAIRARAASDPWHSMAAAALLASETSGVPEFRAAWTRVQLEIYRKQFRNGDSQALFGALDYCGRNTVLMPKWAADALDTGLDRVRTGEATSWDNAFGRPYPKGTRVSSLRKRKQKAALIWADITNAHIYDGRAVDPALFEEIAERHGLKKTVVSGMYYDIKSSVQLPGKKIPGKAKDRRKYKRKRTQ